MPEDEPVDGFTVMRVDDLIVLLLSNRYGTQERFEFSLSDAYRIGKAMVDLSLEHY